MVCPKEQSKEEPTFCGLENQFSAHSSQRKQIHRALFATSDSSEKRHLSDSERKKKKKSVRTRDNATQQPAAAAPLLLILFPPAEMPHYHKGAVLGHQRRRAAFDNHSFQCGESFLKRRAHLQITPRFAQPTKSFVLAVHPGREGLLSGRHE